MAEVSVGSTGYWILTGQESFVSFCPKFLEYPADGFGNLGRSKLWLIVFFRMLSPLSRNIYNIFLRILCCVVRLVCRQMLQIIHDTSTGPKYGPLFSNMNQADSSYS